MKKIYLLPALALATLATQAFATPCTYTSEDDHNGKATFCKFSKTDACNANDTQYSFITGSCTAGNCTCSAIITNCKSYGTLYVDATCETWVAGKDPNAEPLGCCLWTNSNTCYNISSTTDLASCKINQHVFWADIDCPTDTPNKCPTTDPTRDGRPSSSSAGGVSSSGGNNSSSSGGGVSSSSGGFGISSSSGGAGGYFCKLFPPNDAVCIPTILTQDKISECIDIIGGQIVTDCGPSPMFSISSTMGLTVVQNARSLQITSAQEARVQLFDMRGERVMNRSIPAGQATINLDNQKLGVYYAVISSGSNKQTVKVVVR